MPDPTRGERGGPADARPELVVVCGAVRDAVRATGAAMRAPGTVVVAPDLRELGEGVVHRVVTDDSGSRTAVVELTHGCVSCTLREDLLPLLLSLAADRRTLRVVLLLDPGMEPEPVCEALAHLVAEGADGPVTDVLALRGVVAVLDAAHWLDDAGSDDALADRGRATTGDDDRTVAQIVVEHAEFADVLVLAGVEPGLRRPFHPQRLHEAFGVLLTGTVRVRGRLWVATQPGYALWLESAGGALQIGHAGRWLATADPQEWDAVDPERRAAAALRWDEQFGDREQQLVVLAHEAAPADLVAALDAALLTDEELALGEAVWRTWDDPFGTWHTDPCAEPGPDPATTADTADPTADRRRGTP